MKYKIIFHNLCILGLLAGLILTPLASLAAPAIGTINGTVTYNGSQDTNHAVIVGAHLSLDDGPVDSVHIVGPGAYILADLPDGDYYISAFLDVYDRDGGPPEFGEPFGWYDANADGTPDPVTISGNTITGIDILMEDVADEYIQGTACYFGGAQGTGPIEIGLHTVVNGEPVTYQYLSSLPCANYIFNGGPAGTYYVSLFYDLNDSGGPPDPGEPITYYDADGDGNPDPIIYTGDVITDVNIILGKPRHYVDFSAQGNANGTSWEDAYTNLQDAIVAVEAGDEIWVAAGLYTPGTTRDASFELQHGVAIYGGFNGTEDYRHQRNPRANVTILSGEIGDPNAKTDNSYHVVTTASTYGDPLDKTAVLDGFTISGGYANSDIGPDDEGGGLLNFYGTPSLVNLNFIDNYAFNHGGALFNAYTLEPLTVVNCTFSGNSAISNAGGFTNMDLAKIINSSFVGNTGNAGGGIVGLLGSRTEVHNTILWGNQGNEIVLQGSAVATVTYSIVEGGYVGGSHILTADPLFVDADGPDDTYGTLGDDLHLQGISPAIDAGDTNVLLTDAADSDGDDNITESTPTDFEGANRQIDDPTTNTGNGTPPVDMGADEHATTEAISGLKPVVSASTPLNESIVFAGRVASGSQVAYVWDFGDGNTDLGGVVEHTYTLPGTYQVVVMATNSLGQQQATITVSVNEEILTHPGDTITTADDVLTFDIPASMTGTMILTYTPQTTATQSLENFEFAGLAFQLRASDGQGNPFIEPEAAITLTIRYEENALPAGTDEASLELRRYDLDSSQWIALTVIARDPVNDTLTVLLDHFSEYALLRPESLVDNYEIYLPLVVRLQ